MIGLIPAAGGDETHYRVDAAHVWLHEGRSGSAFCDAVWLPEKKSYEMRSQ